MGLRMNCAFGQTVVLLFALLSMLENVVVADDLFRARVAPILERRCLTCHNDEQKEGDFSLRTSQAALKDNHITPGDASSSYLLDLIKPTNGKATMPKDADPLSEAEIELIRQWIDAGAKWPEEQQLEIARVNDYDWWSFQPVTKPAVPIFDNVWSRTPIDAFILEKLRTHGLTHAKEADRRTLIRRATYDLIGLPPTPAEVEAFLCDEDPLAYEKLVDRLLASPHYGERWARHWLDVVKYADTCGYDKDKLRPNAWPYRDYVIRSFNDDKPYSRFVQEQIAGDILFPHEADGITGLGFIAAGPWDFIGHVEVAESKIDGKVARNLDRDDMVSNAINTFCSVTIQCARCHHHKFDPFTQEQYYGLQSIFAAVDRADRPFDHDPQISKRRAGLISSLNEKSEELASLEQEILQAAGPRLSDLNKEIEDLQKKQVVRKDLAFGYHSEVATTSQSTKWVEIVLANPADVTKVVLHTCHDDFAGIGAGFGFPVRYIIEATAGEGDDAIWMMLTDRRNEDVANPGLSPVETVCDAKQVRRLRITATQLAKRQNDYIFALAEVRILGGDGSDQNLTAGATVTSLDSIEMPPRWARTNLVDGKWATRDKGVEKQLAQRLSEKQAILAKIERSERVVQRDTLRKAIAETQSSLSSLPAPTMVYAAATNFRGEGNFKATNGSPRQIHILKRGDVQSPGEVAKPGVLPLQKDENWTIKAVLSEAERRAALAHWLTRRDHPLVWRSIVNRVWQFHFGTGLVATPNDFGRMGALPTHPELLDWLTCEFRDGGGSLKSLHRMIVLSSVYRQSSEHDEHNAAIDGSNQYLWRMNRRRLEAEELRDSILSATGVLDKTMGGPGYYLFELERAEHSPHYEYHKFNPSNPLSHRRSIYGFIVRSQPNPWMTTLDCADSSQSTPKRNETLTSLQALSLLNNRFVLVLAQMFSDRLKREATTLDEQVELAVQIICQRTANEEERVAFKTYAQQHGLQNLCRFLFNLSEFVFLD